MAAAGFPPSQKLKTPLMENGIPFRDTLATVMTKNERRLKSSSSKSQKNSKTSLVFAFFSCLAWLYVAGRLWQDAENRILLNDLLKTNSGQRPKTLTVEDKMMVLGCKDLAKRITEVEMDLTLAKSQGYLKGKKKVGILKSFLRLLVFILVSVVV